MPGEPKRSAFICHVIGMLTAIRLDDESMPDANEVDDERTQGALAPKFVTSQTSAAESSPKATFGVGHIPA